MDQFEHQLAYGLGRAIAEKGWVAVNGGGPGLMHRLLEGAKSAGGTTRAVRLERHSREQSPFADQFTSSADLRARQAQMLLLADAFVALPGGIGTHYEIFEILALKNAGEMAAEIPLILLGDFFRPLERYLQSLIHVGHARGEAQAFFRFAADTSQCIEILSGFATERD